MKPKDAIKLLNKRAEEGGNLGWACSLAADYLADALSTSHPSSSGEDAPPSGEEPAASREQSSRSVPVHLDWHEHPFIRAGYRRALDDVVAALENGYHPQNPSAMHPTDYVTQQFKLPGHEGLRDG